MIAIDSVWRRPARAASLRREPAIPRALVSRLAAHQVRRGEGVGPTQRPHRDVLGSPSADPRQPHQVMNLLLDVRGDARLTRRSHTACASATMQRVRLPTTPSAPISVPPTSSMRGALGRPMELGIRGLESERRSLRPAPGHGGRGFHRDLLPEHRAHGELEAIERPRDAQPRQTPHHVREQGVRAQERAHGVGRRAEVE